MNSVSMRSIGEGSTRLVNSDRALRHPLRLGIAVSSISCTVSDPSVVLASALAREFGGIGSTAAEKPLSMRMQCPSAGLREWLTVTDSLVAGNTSDRLTPGADSTARGVGLPLLHGGAPLRMGQQIRLVGSAAGDQGIPFSARYIRTDAARRPVSIKGQATITATYD